MRQLKIMGIFLVCLGLFIAGCGGKTQLPKTGVEKSAATAVQENKTSSGKVVLQMWVMPNSLEPVRDIEAILAPFEEANPDIDIRVTSVDWGSAWTKITTAATSGDTPDIVQLGSTWVGSISAMGALLDLQDKVSEIGGSTSFIPAAWKSTGLEGTKSVTAVPWFVDARALFFRTDVLRQLKLSKDDLKTWASFENSLTKIKNAEPEIEGVRVYPLGIPGKNDWNVIHNIAPWIWAAGGDFLSKDRKSAAINSSAAVDGVLYYVSLVKKGLIPIDALELNTAQVSSNFNNGSYGMYFDGPYEVKTLTLPPEQGGSYGSIASRNFGVSSYPAGPNGKFTFVGGSDLSIFKNSKHKEEAWKVIKHLVTTKMQVNYAKATGFLPATKAAFSDPYFASDPFRAVFKEAVQYGRTYPCVAAWGLIEPILTRRLGIMWDHILAAEDEDIKAIVKDDLDAAAKEINSVLSVRR
ncbi:MAG: sugar ABC transporter substrate-binding protein [Candidatus Saganbacteria bacterium]|nr:sugar ABC transporter substrate-binding protein [Candidatus Saganbacteria bacterium]